MLRRKPQIEDHKKAAESQLLARMQFLKSKGFSGTQIQRDPKVKHHKAAIRKANMQLADIAELEERIAEQAEAKARKQTAPVPEPSPKKKSSGEPAKKKAKKERKIEPQSEE